MINATNKLGNTKFIAPNLPVGLRINDYIKLDKKLIIQICSKAIPLNTVKQLP